ncbi:MAG: TonB-dependent receptor [Verrucomicrobiales bacterium]|nr:TonB-dependent receptor [Verrucomicrobiales bacterium]
MSLVLVASLWLTGAWPRSVWAAPSGPGPGAGSPTNGVVVLSIEGEKAQVAISRSGSSSWDPAYVGQVLQPGDRGRTGPDSRLSLRLSDLSFLRISERSEFTIKQPPSSDQTYGMALWKGLLYLFHRDKPGSTRIDSRTASAATRGTEFVVAVDEASQQMTLTVLAGAGELTNDQGSVEVPAGERGGAALGGKPERLPRVEANNVIQWVLYYPGILDVGELPLAPEEARLLQGSLEAYRKGDLSEAFRAYPKGAALASEASRVYRAALHLSLGQVDAAEAALRDIGREGGSSVGAVESKLAEALRRVVVAVRNPAKIESRGDEQSESATVAMALSYEQQALRDLPAALKAARKAVERRPEFGFGWARVAELEFGFARASAAREALEQALRLSPQNAQAVALSGFVAMAEYRWSAARAQFERAISLDGGLANAWLGRGLLRIQAGDVAAGREDLQMAASLEPQRGILRSYLAKAWQESNDLPHAREELALAKALDPRDPTAWLYSALLNQSHHRLNEAVRDLEQSQVLNDNRAVYRSELLLDRDRAVRSANLAALYADTGLFDVGLAEASRAISSDYADYSAHLFLANSYNRLRDPHQINTRLESPWLSEYLIANLLAPAGAGTLSQTVSDQEYSRFFERDGFGLVSKTDYLSRGDWLESAAHYGRFARMSYAIETSYRSERGQRPNEDFTSHLVDVQFKQDFSARDSLYVQALYYDAESGDLTPYYNPAQSFSKLRVQEKQEPIVLAGYRHEWAPGVQTLFLAGRLHDHRSFDLPDAPSYVLLESGLGTPVGLPVVLDQSYQSRAVIYTAELQQIVQKADHTYVFGGRAQLGGFDSENRYSGLTAGSGFPQLPVEPSTRSDADFERFSTYVYDHWQWSPRWLAVAGLTYDHIRYPLNHRFAPLAAGEQTQDQVSPKLGLIWTPRSDTTLRAAFSRSLGGVAFDQSFQLEPSQIVGFNQVFRSLMPESVADANSASEFQIGALAIEHRVSSNTWVGLIGEWLTSEVDRTTGAWNFFDVTASPLPSMRVREHLNYEERSLTAYAYQLLGQEWSLGGRYRLSHAELDLAHPDLPSTAFPVPPFGSPATSALLHQLRLFLQFQHPGGFFSSVEALWHRQQNFDYTPDLPGDQFWQLNVYAGYRWPNRRAEVRLGLLNVTGQDYRLNSLNLTDTLPRERTLALTLKLNF